MKLLSKEILVPIVVGAFTGGVGMGIGYFLGRKGVKKSLDELSGDVNDLRFERDARDKEFNFQIQQASYILKQLREEGSKHLHNMADRLEERQDDQLLRPRPRYDQLQIMPLEDLENEFEVESIGTIPHNDHTKKDGWDDEVEFNKRRTHPGEPYTVCVDEFYDQEYGHYNKATINYWEDDNVLIDEDNLPMSNPEDDVGEIEFGYGSGNPDVCYKRNDILEIDYEILRNYGSYEIEVIAAREESRKRADELKHSVPKFRPE